MADYAVTTLSFSMATKTHPEYHRKPFIIWRGPGRIFAEFDTLPQCMAFMQTLGLHFHSFVADEETASWGGLLSIKTIREGLLEPNPGGFYTLEDVCQDAMPIMATSNGSTVTCYYYNDGYILRFYRPNPNAKAVYKPLSLEAQTKYREEHGSF